MSITIELQGACTNFQPSELNGNVLPQGLDRVVLVNADQEIVIDGFSIPPHPAWLRIPDLTLRLQGCTLAIANPVAQGLSYDPSYSPVPDLTALMAEQNWVLGPPSPAVVSGDAPALASCYVDFASGTFFASLDGAAYEIRVVVETDGDPRLTLTPFPGSTMSPQELTLPSASVVIVSHRAENDAADPFGFLLHYLTAAVMPPDPVIVPPPEIAVSASCSNSTYP